MTTTEHIVIHGILPGKPYRSKDRYALDQAAEIPDITIKTTHAAVDELVAGQVRSRWVVLPSRIVTVVQYVNSRFSGMHGE